MEGDDVMKHPAHISKHISIISFCLSLILFLSYQTVLRAQNSTMQLNESLSEQIEDLAMGKVLLGDYDADGDIDIIISGQAHSIKTLIYRNDGASVYTEIDPGFPELLFPDLSWSDFDGDGDLDVFLSGAQEINDTLFPQSHLYIFQDTSFTELPANIEGVYSGCSGWADFDLDGDRDLIISGAKETPSNAWVTPTLCRIYVNDGSGQFSEIQAGIKAVFNASIDIADYDNDQYPDIITTGELYDDGGNWHRSTFLYHNDGANVFSHIEAGLPALRAGDVSFGDYDDDGYTDILLTGDPLSPTNLVYIFRNNTMGNFYDIGIEIIGTEEGTIDWADYDNDGDLDFLVTGLQFPYAEFPVSEFYRNAGGDLFSNDHTTVIEGLMYSSVCWGDMDNDNDPDLVIMGYSDKALSGPRSLVYDNISSTGIDLNTYKQISVDIHPVPATDILNIQINSPGLTGIMLRLVDLSGNIIMEKAGINLNNGVNNTQLELNNLKGGTYILMILDDDMAIHRQKLIIAGSKK